MLIFRLRLTFHDNFLTQHWEYNTKLCGCVDYFFDFLKRAIDFSYVNYVVPIIIR